MKTRDVSLAAAFAIALLAAGAQTQSTHRKVNRSRLRNVLRCGVRG